MNRTYTASIGVLNVVNEGRGLHVTLRVELTVWLAGRNRGWIPALAACQVSKEFLRLRGMRSMALK